MIFFGFGEWELDTEKFELRRVGIVVSVEPQTFSIIKFLIENRDRVVTKSDLHETIWKRRTVSDWAVSAGIKSARIALADTDAERRFIRTVHGKGFRFVAEVTADPGPASARHVQKPRAVSFAVVPFENLSDGTDLDYLADGLSEDLITDLSTIAHASVASRNASFSLKTISTDILAATAHLQVSHLLAGSVRRHGNALRINVRMLEAQTGQQQWAERFDGTGDDIFSLQDQILSSIVRSLRLHLEIQSARRGTRDPLAYECCLRGRSEYYNYSPDHMARALSFFEKATAIDPEYAEAYAYQAYCRTATYVFTWPGSDETLDHAISLARKAILLDNRSAVAHARLGWILGYIDQYDDAVASFERAVARDPKNAEVYFAFGEMMNRLGQPKRALRLLDTAFGIESYVPPSWNFGKGHAYALMRRYEQALDQILPVLERVPKFIPARVQLARIYFEMGRAEEARATVETIGAFAPNYRLASVRRMFPYPQSIERARLHTALSGSGMAD
ncbi:MAG: tetratricopeptide repeat protein [Hyphomicrobiales bacterium]|nr:tetratricopeptide repeat protein [Hyphomicrobiales bacterium]